MSASRDYFPTCGQIADERLQDRIYRDAPGPSGGRGAPRGAAAASAAKPSTSVPEGPVEPPFGPPVEWDACIDCGIAFPAGYRHHLAVRCDDCDDPAPSSPSTTSSSTFVDVVARIVLAPKEAT
jgi:hypothetical protein